MTDWLGAVAQWANEVVQKGGGGIPNAFYAKSLAFRNDTLLSTQTVKDLFNIFDKADKGTLGWFAIFDLAGGATNDIDQAATGYAHRDALFYLQSYAISILKVSDKTKKFLDDINTLIEDSMPEADLGAYAGYVDPALPEGEAQERYWGSNYPRLQSIKRKYDPKDMFHNPQVREPLNFLKDCSPADLLLERSARMTNRVIESFGLCSLTTNLLTTSLPQTLSTRTPSGAYGGFDGAVEEKPVDYQLNAIGM